MTVRGPPAKKQWSEEKMSIPGLKELGKNFLIFLTEKMPLKKTKQKKKTFTSARNPSAPGKETWTARATNQIAS